MMNRAHNLPARRALAASVARLMATRSVSNPLAPFLERQGVVLLDGGTGTALGDDPQKHALWGAQLLFSLKGHEVVLEAHRKFLEAGADVICTNSYQVSFEAFTHADAFSSLPGGAITKEKFQLRYTNDVLRTSVELAKKARHDFWKASSDMGSRLRPLVAAAVGPAGDNLSVWTGATDAETSVHDVPDEAVALYYRRKLAALEKSKPDLIALETIPSLREARLALAALEEVAPERPAWVAFICRDGATTAAGDDFGDAVREVSQHRQVMATGLNCTAPGHVEALLRRAKAAAPDAALVAYPNSGEAWDAREGERCWSGAGSVLGGDDASAMRTWGAALVGGCCRVTDVQIRQFRDALLRATPSA